MSTETWEGLGGRIGGWAREAVRDYFAPVVRVRRTLSDAAVHLIWQALKATPWGRKRPLYERLEVHFKGLSLPARVAQDLAFERMERSLELLANHGVVVHVNVLPDGRTEIILGVEAAGRLRRIPGMESIPADPSEGQGRRDQERGRRAV